MIATSELRTPQNHFASPLLRELIRLGGSAEPSEVIAALETELRGELLPADLEVLSSGQVRWHKDVHWCRFKLVQSGHLDASIRGRWIITQSGEAAVEQQVNPLVDI